MYNISNKISFVFLIIIFFSSCHTLEHRGSFLKKQNLSKSTKQLQQDSAFLESKRENKKKKKVIFSEMAPINTPKEKPKVKTSVLNKKIKLPKRKKFSFDTIKNLSEVNLIKKIGESDFIKEEGKLKNLQYYFSKCFLDIYLINKKNTYYVNMIKTRPTELNGRLDIDDCLREIHKNFN
tara:strand:- start:274 stop:810 length:537 start_codon:yes stop_codon:yes gene_type:complete